MRVCLVCAVFFCALSLHAQNSSPAGTPPGTAMLSDTAMPSGAIIDIEIRGLKRTKPHIVRYPLERFLGRDASSLDLNEVEAAIRNLGIVEPDKVEVVPSSTQPGSYVLQVTVTEKWAILPMPVATAGSGGFSAGLFLADTNAFGLRDQAVLGGMYGSAGWMAMAMYNLTPDRKGPPGLSGMFMYNRQEKEDKDRDERIHRHYTEERIGGSLRLYYPFTAHITGSFGLSFINAALKDNPNAFNVPGGDNRFLGFSPGVSIRDSRWDGYLLSQRSASLNYGWHQALEGSSYHTVEFDGIYQYPLVPGFLLSLHTGAFWSSSDDPLAEEGPGKVRVTILPRQFSARQYAGFSAGLEKYLVKAKYGTVSVLGFWQGVFSEGPIGGNEFDHGPSGEIRFYLSRLAIPALGAGLAYNMSSGVYQFTFNAGIGF